MGTIVEKEGAASPSGWVGMPQEGLADAGDSL